MSFACIEAKHMQMKTLKTIQLKREMGFFPIVLQYDVLTLLQSTCHYMLTHYEKMCHVTLCDISSYGDKYFCHVTI